MKTCQPFGSGSTTRLFYCCTLFDSNGLNDECFKCDWNVKPEFYIELDPIAYTWHIFHFSLDRKFFVEVVSLKMAFHIFFCTRAIIFISTQYLISRENKLFKFFHLLKNICESFLYGCFIMVYIILWKSNLLFRKT